MSEIRVNNITNRDGTAGPSIAGIPVVDSNSHFVVPTGRTGQRYADGGENIVRDGLVLYLDAKYSYPGATGTNPDVYTWYDMSGNENNGELKNGVSYSSANGGSIVFDGTNDYINIPNATNLNNLGSQNFTVSMWVYRVTNPPAGNGEMLYQSSNTDNGFLICISGANFRIELRDNQSTNSSVVGVSDVFTAGTWNNVVLSKQGTTYTGYSQGISKGSFTSYQDVSTSTGYVNIGMTDWWGDSFWEGNISQVQVYNRALTASEIQQNYTATKSRYGL